MNSTLNPPLLELTLRPDLGILLGRWGYQPEARELAACYQRLATEALATGCRFWLQDLRQRTVNDPATTQWLLTEFFPDMAQRLGGRLYVAYLFGPALHQHIVETPDYAPPSAYDERPYALDFFEHEGTAIQWLQIHQHWQA